MILYYQIKRQVTLFSMASRLTCDGQSPKTLVGPCVVLPLGWGNVVLLRTEGVNKEWATQRRREMLSSGPGILGYGKVWPPAWCRCVSAPVWGWGLVRSTELGEFVVTAKAACGHQHLGLSLPLHSGFFLKISEVQHKPAELSQK